MGVSSEPTPLTNWRVTNDTFGGSARTSDALVCMPYQSGRSASTGSASSRWVPLSRTADEHGPNDFRPPPFDAPPAP